MRTPAQDGRCCPLCGGRDFRQLHQWETDHPRNSASVPLAFWICTCELALLHPVPTPDQLPQQGDWWSDARKRIYRRPTWKKFRTRLQNWIFGSQRQRLVRQTAKVQPHGRLIDIGAGCGELLAEARLRYQHCVGIEPDRTAAQTAHQRGFEIVQSTLESAPLDRAEFEVAMMDAVLEHLPDPLVALTQVNELLKVGGVVCIKVPKLNGPSHRRHQREWNGFRVGYHTVMFTGDTLRQCLNQCGFEVLASPQRDRWLDDILILWGRKTCDLSVSETVTLKQVA